MILSEDRQSHFAHKIVDGLYHDDLVDYPDDDDTAALKQTKMAIVEWVRQEEQIDVQVREKIQSLKREVIEGTNEWNVLYQKYYEEEMKRRGY